MRDYPRILIRKFLPSFSSHPYMRNSYHVTDIWSAIDGSGRKHKRRTYRQALLSLYSYSSKNKSFVHDIVNICQTLVDDHYWVCSNRTIGCTIELWGTTSSVVTMENTTNSGTVEKWLLLTKRGCTVIGLRAAVPKPSWTCWCWWLLCVHQQLRLKKTQRHSAK